MPIFFLERQSANPDMTFQNLYELYMEDMAARPKQSTILTKKHIYETGFVDINLFCRKIDIGSGKRQQLMNSPNGYSKTYLKTINNQLTCIITAILLLAFLSSRVPESRYRKAACP